VSLKLERRDHVAIERLERGEQVERSNQTHIATESENETDRFSAAQREEDIMAEAEETWRASAFLTVYINHHISPVKVKLTIAPDGISLNFLLANAVPDSVSPTFRELVTLCKQLSTESIEMAGHDVHEFIRVLWYSILAYILGTEVSLLHRYCYKLQSFDISRACDIFPCGLEEESNLQTSTCTDLVLAHKTKGIVAGLRALCRYVYLCHSHAEYLPTKKV